MLINYSHIVSKPKIEKKTRGHFLFIRKQFNCSYLTCTDFIKRDDLFVVVLRNANNHFVGLTLVKDTIESERKAITYPSSKLPRKKSTLLNTFYFFRPTPNQPRRIWVKQTPTKYHEIEYHVYRVVFTLVSKKFRGMGYNQILLDYVYNKAVRTKDCRKIIASIRESNTASLKSFEKNGYRISKWYTKPYKNGEKKIRVYKSTTEREKKTVLKETTIEINKIIKEAAKKLEESLKKQREVEKKALEAAQKEAFMKQSILDMDMNMDMG